MIYIASPYTHSDPDVMQQRYEDVAVRCANWARQGWVVYSPIVHWHPIAVTHDLPRDHHYWRFHDHEMIQCCRELWALLLPGWQDSEGLAEDRRIAKTYHKKVSVIRVS